MISNMNFKLHNDSHQRFLPAAKPLSSSIRFEGGDMKTKIQPRKLMEQAIEVIREFVHEPQTDGIVAGSYADAKRPPISTFAHSVVQKLLKPDNGARRKGMP